MNPTGVGMYVYILEREWGRGDDFIIYNWALAFKLKTIKIKPSNLEYRYTQEREYVADSEPVWNSLITGWWNRTLHK